MATTIPAPGHQPPVAHAPSPVAPVAPRQVFASDLLARVWQQSLPLVRTRVDRLSASAREAASGPLQPATRVEAADLAHKLAGSLGMFGLPEGTAVAREMELLLETEETFDPARYSQLVTRLQGILNL